MKDVLFWLAQQRAARRLLKTVGLPAPQALARAQGPYTERFLNGRGVLLGSGPTARAMQEIAAILETAGADYRQSDIPGPDGSESNAGQRFDALVFDATGLDDVADLKCLYDFFHPVVRGLSVNARVVVLTSAPDSTATLAAAASARAVEGFVRSLAKEIGRRGATANLLYVEPGAEKRISGPLRFFLSDYSTFVDGQAVTINNAGPAPRSMPWVQPLEGKVALVTGAAQGIGAETARRLATEGAHVVCLDRPEAKTALDAVVTDVAGTVLALDISDAHTPRAIVDFLQSQFGGVDIVVHNAGVTRDKTLGKMSAAHWNQVLAVNLQAIVAIDAVMADANLVNDHGRIVCLCSIGGIAGNAGQTNYATTKAGLIGFVECRGVQSRERGICVNAVAPGFIETDMTAAMPLLLREAGRRLASLSQGGQPRDVAEVITFLATPGAAGLSGNVLRVCGQSLIGA